MKSGLILSEGQAQAKKELLGVLTNPSPSPDYKFCLLQGAAGTGKTTLVVDIINSLRAGASIALTAPTHKAAKVLYRMAVRQGISHLVQVMTIHSALGLKLSRVGEQEVLIRDQFTKEKYFDYLMVDEGSMLNDELLIDYISETKSKKCMFIADRYQIGPIETKGDHLYKQDEPYNPWTEDAPLSKIFDHVSHQSNLSEIMRCALDNPIISLATSFKEAQDNPNIGFPAIEKNLTEENHGIDVLDLNHWKKEIVNHFKSDEFKQDPDFCRVVTYTNDAAKEIISFVRRLIHGDNIEDFIVGETVMALESGGLGEYKNSEEFEVVDVQDGQDDDYGLKCLELTVRSFEDETIYTKLVVHSDDEQQYSKTVENLAQKANEVAHKYGKPAAKPYWGQYWAIKDKFKNFRHIYASTAHKAQGSTFTNTYIYTPDFIRFGCNLTILRLLYTAITRSSEKTTFCK